MMAGFLCLLLQLNNPPAPPMGKGQVPGPVPVEQMALSATVIGVGTVLESSVRQDPVTRMIYTDYRVQFSDVWKGDPQDPFVVSKAGGSLNGSTVAIVGHDYDLGVGESLVFFVHPSSAGSFHVVIGLQSGLFRIPDGEPNNIRRVGDVGSPKRGGEIWTLSELRSHVFKALGKSAASPSASPPANLSPKGVSPAASSAPASAGASVPASAEVPVKASQDRGEPTDRSILPFVLIPLVLAAMALGIRTMHLKGKHR